MNIFKAGQYAQYRDSEEQYTILVLSDSTSYEMRGVVVDRLGFTIPDDDLAYDIGDVQERFHPSSFTRVKNPLKSDDKLSSVGRFYQHTCENFTMLATGVKYSRDNPVAVGVVVALGVWMPGQPDIGDVVERPCGEHWNRVKNPLKWEMNLQRKTKKDAK